MELRWLKIKIDEPYYVRPPVLQYRNDPEEGWTDVPVQVLRKGEFNEETGLP